MIIRQNSLYMITIAELFPLHSTASKWLKVFREVSTQEFVRLEKEYTVIAIITENLEREEVWYLDDEIHRSDGPAIINYYKNGSVISQEWWVHNETHREGLPARITYFENGDIESQQWWTHSVLGRKDGCSTIWYKPDGSIYKTWK